MTKLPSPARPARAPRPRARPHRPRTARPLAAAGLLLLVSAVRGEAAAPSAAPAAETLTYGRFGTVSLYRETPHPKNVVLFVSGDGGWNLGVVDMARTLAQLDSLVVGINLPRYVKALSVARETCSYPAADFELLSKYVQKKLEFPTYTPPVLVGYSSGATLVYALLVQAPPNTFKGAVSMGFCPDLPLRRPLCKGNGLTWGPGPKGKGFSFKPATVLEQPWIAFQGETDQVCFPHDVEAFVKQVPKGEAVMLPKVGHGFSVARNWEPQFKEAFQRLAAEPQAPPPPPAQAQPVPAPRSPTQAPAAPLKAVSDLPLVEVPVKGAGSLLAVVVSGDGGWASIDREVAGRFAARGVPVVGLNSLQYFWKARTPEEASADLARVLRHYLAAWNRQQVLLAGYSLGADVLPFMTNRLPPDLQGRVRLLALLGPGRRASFQFHLTDWLTGTGGGDLPILPEVKKLAGMPLLCLYGEDERDDSLCTQLGRLGKAVGFSGSHHFGGNYDALAASILSELQAPTRPASPTGSGNPAKGRR